jgi:hypothetical protein
MHDYIPTLVKPEKLFRAIPCAIRQPGESLKLRPETATNAAASGKLNDAHG